MEQGFAGLSNSLLLVTLAVNVGLGVFVLVYNYKSEINRVFSIFLLSLAVLIGTFLFFLNLPDTSYLLLARRLTPCGSALAAGLFLYFSLIFPRSDKFSTIYFKILAILPGILLAFASFFSDWMIKDVIYQSINLPAYTKVVYGPGYAVFAAYFTGALVLGILILLNKYWRAQGRERAQLFYVIFGVAVAGGGGALCSVFLPLLDFPQWFAIGPAFSVVLAGACAYAIIKHNFLEVNTFISRGLLYLLSSVLLAGSFWIIVFGHIAYLLPFYTIIMNLALVTVVLTQAKDNPINRAFAGIIFAVILWSAFLFLSNATPNYYHALWWNKLIYIASAFIPPLALYFVQYFPFVTGKVDKLRYVSIAGCAIMVYITAFTNWVIQDIFFVPAGTKVVLGMGHAFYAFYLVFFLALAFYQLFKKYAMAQGAHKAQIAYVLLGSLLTSAAAITTNIILPVMGETQFTAFGPLSLLILFSFTAYAIVKHRLMSIEIVIQLSTVYAVTTVLIMAFYAIAVIASETILRSLMGYSSLFITTLITLFIAIAYQPLVRTIQGVTDRLFFRGKYDYQKTLREISQKITSVIRIEELTVLLVSSFIDTMKVSEISFLLLDRNQEHYRSAPLYLPHYKMIEIDADSPIIKALFSAKDILLRDEVAEVAAREAMERLGIYVWVPIISKDQMIGIIALGNKLSGDVFTSEDIGLLSTLANQAAVALDNARLYDEVVSSRDYVEKVLQSMVSGVMTVDMRGRIITFNPAAEKITGRRAIDLIGKTCEEVWGKRGIIANVVEGILKNNRIYFNFESGVVSPERGLVSVSFSSNALLDPRGNKIGSLITIQDLSEVKELEGKVRRADKLSALATMAAGMAHEIKNPLSSMKVLSQLLPKKIDDPEFRGKLEEILPREINRIDRIVESLLGFARATTLSFEKADLNEILQEQLNYFEPQAKEAEVKIVHEFAALPPIEIDRAQLGQVFSNLILNAIQAMHGGGVLTVKTLPGKKLEDILRTVKVVIADSGHGIPEETLKKLFDPFFTTKYGGTGLGLTITHSIVDGHKGYIDVESTVGKGTTFTITLPVEQGLV